ncbi:MAG: hypothetical protein DME22_02410 [Verrucomicrobia bacterium]|nr:MAG: hypothetical protein DME22_02410 [Verrucomicrobiota bacterium]
MAQATGSASVKKPRLLYFEEALDGAGGWCFAPDKVEHIIDVENMRHGETASIEFKCVFMTDEEVAAVPEV